MSTLRSVGLVLTLVALLVACAGSPASTPVPTDVPGPPVVTPDDALQAVIAAEPRLAGIRPFDPDGIGQAASYEIMQASGVGAFIVSVRVGWGDCQAGCIDEHSWVYAVAPDGTVTTQSESGPPVPAEAWPAPGAGGGTTGLDVTVRAGPTCPVETEPPMPGCEDRPVPGAIIAIRQDDVEVARLTSDAGGHALIDLPAGAYTVEARPMEGFMGVPAVAQVSVEDGRVAVLELVYDTGIR